jgi:hypothetical protein
MNIYFNSNEEEVMDFESFLEALLKECISNKFEVNQIPNGNGSLFFYSATIDGKISIDIKVQKVITEDFMSDNDVRSQLERRIRRNSTRYKDGMKERRLWKIYYKKVEGEKEIIWIDDVNCPEE